MTTFTNNTGTKLVKITKDGTGAIRAMYVQVYYNGEQDVMQAKTFKTETRATKWAKTILNIN
jgi:hypothetical protein